ncbi:MAG: acyltransferase [Candidatus Anammoxibacter sp.]
MSSKNIIYKSLYFILKVIVVPVVITRQKIRNAKACKFFFNLIRYTIWKAKLKKIGEGSNIYSSVIINYPEQVSLGDRVHIAEFVHIWGGGKVNIGNDVLIAAHTIITSMTHDAHAALFSDTVITKPVVIESNVWIGSGSIILPGVCIGEGSIVGAGSVVTKNVPKRSVVVGVPAKVVRELGVDNK